MAQKDYVSRGQKNKKKAQEKKPVSWLGIMLSLALLSAFVVGLYYLKNEPQPNAREAIVSDDAVSSAAPLNDEQDIALVNESSAEQKLKASLDKDPLPVMGEEEWAFIDALPEYSVEIDMPELEETNYIYIMQCGSFRTTERAQELRAQIALQGFESELISNDGANGLWHRVVLGPFDRKREAERVRHQVRRANINTCKIYQRS